MQYDEGIACQAFVILGGFKSPRRLIERLVSKDKGTPMHSHGLLRTCINMHLHSLFGIHVVVLHEPSRLVGTDRDGGQIERSEYLGDTGEAVEVAGDAGEVEALVGSALTRPSS